MQLLRATLANNSLGVGAPTRQRPHEVEGEGEGGYGLAGNLPEAPHLQVLSLAKSLIVKLILDKLPSPNLEPPDTLEVLGLLHRATDELLRAKDMVAAALAATVSENSGASATASRGASAGAGAGTGGARKKLRRDGTLLQGTGTGSPVTSAPVSTLNVLTCTVGKSSTALQSLLRIVRKFVHAQLLPGSDGGRRGTNSGTAGYSSKGTMDGGMDTVELFDDEDESDDGSSSYPLSQLSQKSHSQSHGHGGVGRGRQDQDRSGLSQAGGASGGSDMDCPHPALTDEVLVAFSEMLLALKPDRATAKDLTSRVFREERLDEMDWEPILAVSMV